MKLRIERVDDLGHKSVEVHEVPDRVGMTVLDALCWVREHVDATIALRFSCRSANACKECLSLVDGERKYTCTTPAIGEVTVGPLPNKTPIRDLVTPM